MACELTAGIGVTDGAKQNTSCVDFNISVHCMRYFYCDAVTGFPETVFAAKEYRLMTRSWYTDARSHDSPLFSSVYLDFSDSSPIISPSVPLYDLTGRFIGVVAADVLLTTVEDILVDASAGAGTVL